MPARALISKLRFVGDNLRILAGLSETEKIRRVRALCKTVGLKVKKKKTLSRLVKQNLTPALRFARKFRARKTKNFPKLRRTLSCPTSSSEGTSSSERTSRKGQDSEELQETQEGLVLCPSAPEGKELVLGCVEHSFAETRRRHSSVSAHSKHPNQAALVAFADHNPSCDDSDFDESSESEEEPESDYSPPRPPELGPRCRGSTPDHHLRCEIIATQEAMKRNAGHIDFVTNCQSQFETSCSLSNSFAIGSKVLAKNERLLTETLLILTAALEDIPVNLRTCDCPFKSLTKADRDVVVS